MQPRPPRELDLATLCARPDEPAPSTTIPLAAPIELSAVFRVADLDHIDALYESREPGFIYARDGHPAGARLATKIAALEAAEAALICSSGMAAEAALMLSSLGQGDHVALSDGLYGKTAALAAREFSRFGVEHSWFDPTQPETLREVLRPNTKLVFVETISNPLLRLANLAGLSEVARSAGAMVVVDNTFAPLLCRPLEWGASAVVHSLTKLIGGHSDVTLGAVAGARELVARVGATASTFGQTGAAFDCWLTSRGLATLPLRSGRACATAMRLAELLAAHPKVAATHYPGLASHPDHALATRLLQGGFGTIVTIDLGGRAEVDAFIRGLSGIVFAPSLGDVATTLSHPSTTSHRGQSAEQWSRQGIHPGLVRLSVGLEAFEDLRAELEHALTLLS